MAEDQIIEDERLQKGKSHLPSLITLNLSVLFLISGLDIFTV
jgi:hypothetical protein